MERTELKKNIRNYLTDNSNNLKSDLTKAQLRELKELLDKTQKLGAENFAEITGGTRFYECYLDEINRKLKLLRIKN